jgi:hypothetical protein
MRGAGAASTERKLSDSDAPDGTAKYASATRIAVKPCAYGAPLRGYGA